ncbi:MAG: Ig-like domain-containing protein [Gemmatirosa sp.]|nr:Ig-like domain-containing protein [Gemmatirosa sp.]
MRATLFAVVVCLAACGGGTTSPSPTSPTTPAPAATDVPASIAVAPGTLAFDALGRSDPMRAEVRDASGRVIAGTVTWASSNAAVATVSADGIVTSQANGAADVTATLGSLRATVHVTVAQRAAAVAMVGSTDVTLPSTGSTLQLAAAVRDAGGRDVAGASVAWSSSDASVARVSTTGLVTAARAGTATISAALLGMTASTKITVATSGPATPAACAPFTENLIDPALVKVVTQIGVIGGANTEIVGRSYVFANDGQDGRRLPLTAPTALRLVGAKHYVPPGAPAGYTPDWSLYFQTDCGIALELFHVKDVSAAIKAVVDTTVSPSSAWTQLPSPVSLAAGETFGWYVRGLNSVAFDVIAHDASAVHQWANPARYEAMHSNLRDIVCPWSLFAPARRDAYLALVGAPTGQRVPNAGCGTVERDVAGTPAGQWFLTPTAPASWQLSKSGDYGDPMPIILGVDGTVYIGHTGPSDDIRIDRANPTWKDPATITTAWCYQTGPGASAPGWLWLRMVSATEMQAAYGGGGACPAAFPSTGFATYYR